MTETPGPEPGKKGSSKVLTWLLAIIAGCLLLIVGAGIWAYVSLRSAADRIEARADKVETAARDLAGRATSATKAGLIVAADKLGDARANITSATREGLAAAEETYDETKEKLTSATASATSRTKALLAVPGEKWSEWRDRKTTETDSMTTDTIIGDAPTSTRMERLRRRVHSIRESAPDVESVQAATSGTISRLRDRFRRN